MIGIASGWPHSPRKSSWSFLYTSSSQSNICNSHYHIRKRICFCIQKAVFNIKKYFDQKFLEICQITNFLSLIFFNGSLSVCLFVRLPACLSVCVFVPVPIPAHQVTLVLFLSNFSSRFFLCNTRKLYELYHLARNIISRHSSPRKLMLSFLLKHITCLSSKAMY